MNDWLKRMAQLLSVSAEHRIFCSRSTPMVCNFSTKFSQHMRLNIHGLKAQIINGGIQ